MVLSLDSHKAADLRNRFRRRQASCVKASQCVDLGTVGDSGASLTCPAVFRQGVVLRHETVAEGPFRQGVFSNGALACGGAGHEAHLSGSLLISEFDSQLGDRLRGSGASSRCELCPLTSGIAPDTALRPAPPLL